MLARTVIAAAIVAALTGCAASVDESNHIVNNRVWFDQHGVAHCPHADCMPLPHAKAKPGSPAADATKDPLRPSEKETAESRVMRHRNVCDKGHAVHWTSDEVLCWTCNGGGKVALREATIVEGSAPNFETRKALSDVCDECEGVGLIRYGGTARRPF